MGLQLTNNAASVTTRQDDTPADIDMVEILRLLKQEFAPPPKRTTGPTLWDTLTGGERYAVNAIGLENDRHRL